jgi:hypothetical protein
VSCSSPLFNLTKSIELDNLETQEIFLFLGRICRYKNKNRPPAARWNDAKPLNLGGDGGMKMRKIILPFVLLGSVFVAGQNSPAQCIPVASELVRGTCGGCHQVDARLCMSRISYQRKTPEGWEDTVRRMGRMNGIPSSASQAREIIRYLADAQGLTSSEVQGIAYALEKQLNVQENVP